MKRLPANTIAGVISRHLRISNSEAQSRLNNQCAEPQADPVLDKERANFCDFFRPRANAFVADEAEGASDAKTTLDALFGGDDDDGGTKDEIDDKPPTEEDATRAELEKLFRKTDDRG